MSYRSSVCLTIGVMLAVAGFFAGRELRNDNGSAAAYDFKAPAYAPSDPIAGFSRGGFTGFGETPGLDGKTIIAGRVIELTGDSFTLESAAGVRSTVRLADEAPLRRIEAATAAALRPGANVIVRKQPGKDEAAAVLVVAAP